MGQVLPEQTIITAFNFAIHNTLLLYDKINHAVCNIDTISTVTEHGYIDIAPTHQGENSLRVIVNYL